MDAYFSHFTRVAFSQRKYVGYPGASGLGT